MPPSDAAIRALCDAATPGPWYAELGGYVYRDSEDDRDDDEEALVDAGTMADAAFIAAAREALPALLDRVAAAERHAADATAAAQAANNMAADAEAKLAVAVAALEAAATELLHAGQGEPGYGYFCGGDPREFTPDPECSTDEERAAHKRDCEAWERGEQTHSVQFGTSAFTEGTTHGHVHHAGYGLGTYQFSDERIMAAYERAREALAAVDALDGGGGGG